MRFLKLDLLAFGHFTNRELVFPGSGPNFHLIFGGNEAGKSTTLRAISGFLYDIDVQTKDDFLHPKASLRIGARLQHSSGEERAFIRKKGKAGTTLLDGQGRPVVEEELQSWLSVSDRDQFQQMFGLSHEQLRAAGEALASAEDDAGRMLFGAALNGTSLNRALLELDEETKKAFIAAREALSRHQQKRKAAAEKLLSIRDFTELHESTRAAETERETRAGRIRDAMSERSGLLRVSKALPLLARRADLLSQRAALGDVRLLGPEVASTRKELLAEVDSAQRASSTARARIEGLTGQRSALVVRDDLLAASARINLLAQELGKYNAERTDLPSIVRVIIGHENSQRGILRELGLPELPISEIGTLRVDEAARRRIQTLERARTQVESELGVGRRSIAAKRAEEKQCVEKLSLLAAPVDVGVLRATWEQLADRSIDERLRQADATLREREARIEDTCAEMRPWEVEPLQAPRLAVPPPETLERMAEEESDNRRELKNLEKQLHEVDDKAERVEADLRKWSREGELPSEQDLEAARIRRQRGWEHVLKAWKSRSATGVVVEEFEAGHPLAEAYAAAVLRADELGDRLRTESDRIAQHAVLLEEQAALQRKRRMLQSESQALESREQERAAAWKRLWAATGLQPGSPREMQAWRKRFEALQAAVRAREEALRLREQHSRVMEEQQRALENALAAAGAPVTPGLPWTMLCARVQRTLEGAERGARELTALTNERLSLSRDLAGLEAAQREGEAKAAALGADWAEAVAVLRLPAQASGEEATSVLDKLADLFRIEDLRESVDKRRKAIGKQQEKFEAELVELAGALAPDLAVIGQHSSCAKTIVDRHGEAQRLAATRQQLDEQIGRARAELVESEEALRIAQRRIDALLRETDCASIDALKAAERTSEEARRLDEEIRRTHDNLLIAGDGRSVDELAQAAVGVDSDQIAGRLAELEGNLSLLQSEQEECLQRLGGLYQRGQALTGGEEAARLHAEAQEELAAARPHAARWARMRLSQEVLERAIESYRQKNQSAILRRAEELFHRLTLGRYQHLRIEYEGTKAKLRAVRQNEEVDVARALSDGTLDQLFLSLRLASIEQHLVSQEPMPLVLDDIFIHFDDERTRAGLEVLAGFAQKTQVLLLTHHHRNVDLARKTLAPGTWQEHRLAPQLPAGEAAA
jgi:uncharacterized protein YhaN